MSVFFLKKYEGEELVGMVGFCELGTGFCLQFLGLSEYIERMLRLRIELLIRSVLYKLPSVFSP